jgi:hypothetical protein
MGAIDKLVSECGFCQGEATRQKDCPLCGQPAASALQEIDEPDEHGVTDIDRAIVDDLFGEQAAAPALSDEERERLEGIAGILELQGLDDSASFLRNLASQEYRGEEQKLVELRDWLSRQIKSTERCRDRDSDGVRIDYLLGCAGAYDYVIKRIDYLLREQPERCGGEKEEPTANDRTELRAIAVRLNEGYHVELTPEDADMFDRIASTQPQDKGLIEKVIEEFEQAGRRQEDDADNFKVASKARYGRLAAADAYEWCAAFLRSLLQQGGGEGG